jgi:uncharacterized protein (TIGR02996 family)
MTEREILLGNCLARPGDDAARLVYADYLRIEQDSPLGRFVWAGVTLSRYRGSEPVGEGDFFDAQRELEASAPTILSSQLNALFGWLWPDVLWDTSSEKPDQVFAASIAPTDPHEPFLQGGYRLRHDQGERTARSRNRPAAIYERGMLHTLRLPLARWREVARAVLSVAPLACVELLDVPGCVLRVMGPDACRPGGGWRMSAELKLPAAVRLFDPPASGPANIYRINPAAKLPHGYSRALLVAMAVEITDMLLADLEGSAGERWPGPRTPTPTE